jgi:hypothetical protein
MFADDAQILRIGEGLMTRTLPRAEWNHGAHFAAALWLMRYRPDLEAPRAMADMIRAYNEVSGVANNDSSGYHETITLASLRAARGVLDFNPATMPLFHIANAILASNLADPNWLLEYWSQPRLMSVDARRAWLEPDLKPLPF